MEERITRQGLHSAPGSPILSDAPEESDELSGRIFETVDIARV
jgi:hypothetical protein